MQIQINTDRNLKGGESLTDYINAAVEDSFKRFSAQITRVEVHLGDENGGKHGANDKRCIIEVRIEGRPPVAVTHHADTVGQSIDGAAERMVHLLDHALGRLHDHRAHAVAPAPEADDPAPAN